MITVKSNKRLKNIKKTVRQKETLKKTSPYETVEKQRKYI